MTYIFRGIDGKYNIPHGALVEIVRFYPRRKALVKYRGRLVLTFSTLLRKRPA